MKKKIHLDSVEYGQSSPCRIYAAGSKTSSHPPQFQILKCSQKMGKSEQRQNEKPKNAKPRHPPTSRAEYESPPTRYRMHAD